MKTDKPGSPEDPKDKLGDKTHEAGSIEGEPTDDLERVAHPSELVPDGAGEAPESAEEPVPAGDAPRGEPEETPKGARLSKEVQGAIIGVLGTLVVTLITAFAGWIQSVGQTDYQNALLVLQQDQLRLEARQAAIDSALQTKRMQQEQALAVSEMENDSRAARERALLDASLQGNELATSVHLERTRITLAETQRAYIAYLGGLNSTTDNILDGFQELAEATFSTDSEKAADSVTTARLNLRLAQLDSSQRELRRAAFSLTPFIPEEHDSVFGRVEEHMHEAAYHHRRLTALVRLLSSDRAPLEDSNLQSYALREDPRLDTLRAQRSSLRRMVRSVLFEGDPAMKSQTNERIQPAPPALHRARGGAAGGGQPAGR